MKQEVLQAPYGEPSFEELRELGYAYVDKTPYILALERCGSRFPFILRPRRFGKSLFANMLKAYYDKAAEGMFEQNFAGTWIAEHPTPLANKFLVLKLDFSGISSGPDLIQNVNRKVRLGLIDFSVRYLNGNQAMQRLLNTSYGNPAALLTDFLALVWEQFGQKTNIYLIIDEYDQFTECLLATEPETFRAITSKEGFLKDFYTVIKDCSQTIIKRVFITGVTSISLDSMTSGFSITTNLTNVEEFAGAMGFTDEELRKLIPQIIDLNQSPIPADEIFDRMKELYDGYRFSTRSDTTVFNSSMCLYYLDFLSRHSEEPGILLDPSFSVDLSKIKGILSLGSQDFVEKVVRDVLFDRPIKIFALSNSINLNAAGKLTDPDVLTLLVFMGFLSFSKDQPKQLICPNRAVKDQFFRFWFQRFGKLDDFVFNPSDLKQAQKSLETGDARPLLSFISDQLSCFTGGHVHAHLDETAIQLATLMVMNTSSGYIATAEEEALGAGYTDLVLRPKKRNPNAAGWVIEFKHLKASEKSQSAVDRKLAEAKEQLMRYSAAQNIASIQNLHLAAAVFSGTKLVRLEVLFRP